MIQKLHISKKCFMRFQLHKTIKLVQRKDKQELNIPTNFQHIFYIFSQKENMQIVVGRKTILYSINNKYDFVKIYSYLKRP